MIVLIVVSIRTVITREILTTAIIIVITDTGGRGGTGDRDLRIGCCSRGRLFCAQAGIS